MTTPDFSGKYGSVNGGCRGWILFIIVMIIFLVVIGAGAWFVFTYLPMPK